MNKISRFFLPALLVMTCMLLGCEDVKEGYNEEMKSEDTATQMDDDDDDMEIHKAVAVIHSNDMQLDAWVTFTEVEEGIRVQGHFDGLAEGMHAYHVHVYGDCRADDYSSAGPHYVFDPPAPEDAPIVGNLGEFSANPSGAAETDTVITAIDDLEDLIGRAVMVHENGNNLNPPPTGNAGARIACGVIGFANTGSGSGMMNMDM